MGTFASAGSPIVESVGVQSTVVLGVASVGLYWWATPDFVDAFRANWRLAVFGLVGFFLMAKGSGSATAGMKIAPKKDTL